MNIKKIVYILLLTLFIWNVIFLPNIYASTSAGQIIRDGDDFLDKEEGIEEVIDEGKLSNVSSTIYKVLLTIAICVSVIIGAVLGFQFILGSAEGKAKIMESLVPYVVGCIVVFGAFGIWSVFVNLGQNM